MAAGAQQEEEQRDKSPNPTNELEADAVTGSRDLILMVQTVLCWREGIVPVEACVDTAEVRPREYLGKRSKFLSLTGGMTRSVGRQTVSVAVLNDLELS